MLLKVNKFAFVCAFKPLQSRWKYTSQPKNGLEYNIIKGKDMLSKIICESLQRLVKSEVFRRHGTSWKKPQDRQLWRIRSAKEKVLISLFT